MKTKILSPLRRDGFKAGITIIAVIVLSAVLAACSSDDSPTENTESRVAVKLAYTTIDATETRAAQDLNEGTFATGEAVRVRISNTGENNWAEYPFVTAADGAMTATDPAPYYPAGSQNIDIVAYYPGTAWDSFTVYADQTDDADYKASDLMFASVTNQAKQAEAVNLAFSHKMAKLNVNITAGQGVGSITSVSILNVKPTVSFDRATGAVGEASGDATTIAISNQGAALIPAQTIDGGLLSIVTDKGTATYSVSSKAFEAGNLYTMNITVNLRAVGTTTAITGWTSEGTVTMVELTNAPANAVAVDLGLSVKWANMNVGAEAVTDYGTYFAWGETAGITVSGASSTVVGSPAKTYFSWDTYAWCQGAENKFTKYCPTNKQRSYWWDTSGSSVAADNKTQLELADDAARANWGGNWRMPTKDELNALYATKGASGYTWTWKTNYNSVSGCNGWEITCSATGGTIFLPAAGDRDGSGFNVQGLFGSYWSSTLDSNNPGLVWYLGFYSGDAFTGYEYRYGGFTVRAVTE